MNLTMIDNTSYKNYYHEFFINILLWNLQIGNVVKQIIVQSEQLSLQAETRVYHLLDLLVR